MRCTYCGSENLGVIDARSTADGIKRRRICNKCKRRFTAYEKVEEFSIAVRKRYSTGEVFDRTKIFAGIMKACEKRPVSREQIEKIVNGIESTLRANVKSEATSREIGDTVLRRLYIPDGIAYIRFAGVYENFASPEDFRKVAIMLNKKSRYYAERR